MEQGVVVSLVNLLPSRRRKVGREGIDMRYLSKESALAMAGSVSGLLLLVSKVFDESTGRDGS
jgi:hypothetical protein